MPSASVAHSSTLTALSSFRDSLAVRLSRFFRNRYLLPLILFAVFSSTMAMTLRRALSTRSLSALTTWKRSTTTVADGRNAADHEVNELAMSMLTDRMFPLNGPIFLSNRRRAAAPLPRATSRTARLSWSRTTVMYFRPGRSRGKT